MLRPALSALISLVVAGILGPSALTQPDCDRACLGSIHAVIYYV